MQEIMLWIFMGTKGGVNRARIVYLLYQKPCNINQISEKLNLNYKTVKYHTELLEKNGILKCTPGIKYGALFFVSELMLENYEEFQAMYKKLINYG